MSANFDEQSPVDPRLAGLAELARTVAEHRRPPLEQWHPSATAEIGLRIMADGIWHYQASPIRRPALVRLFASILRREADGKHYLVTPVERVLVDVDDAPLLAVEMWVEGNGLEQALSFRSNLDDLIVPDKEKPMRFGADPVTGAPKPYLAVRHGLEALATRSVYLELIETGRIEVLEGARHFGVWSRGCFFPMSPAEALE